MKWWIPVIVFPFVLCGFWWNPTSNMDDRQAIAELQADVLQLRGFIITHWSTEHGVVVPAPEPEFNPPSAEEGDNQLDKHPTKGKERNIMNSNEALQNEIDALSENMDKRFTALMAHIDKAFAQREESLSISFGGVSSHFGDVFTRLTKIEEALGINQKDE